MDKVMQLGAASERAVHRPLISADDHVDMPYVPRDLWTSRLPAGLRAQGPQVMETPEGRFWSWEGEIKSSYGRKIGLLDTFARAGLPTEPEPDVFRPTSVKYRCMDMDADGVQAQVLFPPLGGLKAKDPVLGRAMLLAFNDWFVSDFTQKSNGRLLAVPYVPQDSVEAAIGEVHRLVAMGTRCVQIDPWLGPVYPYDQYWDPLWRAIEEAGLVLHFHIGKGLHSLQVKNESWFMAAATSVVHMQFDEVIPGLIFSGILERHPALQIVFAECGIGWVPYVLEMMDFQQEEWGKFTPASKLPLKASEYFRRQMHVTFEAERVGVRLIPEIGVDNVMWAADYPHGISTFPHSREKIAEMFADTDDELRDKVTRFNAMRIYGFAG